MRVRSPAAAGGVLLVPPASAMDAVFVPPASASEAVLVPSASSLEAVLVPSSLPEHVPSGPGASRPETASGGGRGQQPGSGIQEQRVEEGAFEVIPVRGPDPMDRRLVGTWKLRISTGVSYRTDGNSVYRQIDPGADLDQLQIAADGSYVWGRHRGRAREVKWDYLLKRNDPARFFEVSNGRGLYLVTYSEEPRTLLALFHSGGLMAEGTRLTAASSPPADPPRRAPNPPAPQPAPHAPTAPATAVVARLSCSVWQYGQMSSLGEFVLHSDWSYAFSDQSGAKRTGRWSHDGGKGIIEFLPETEPPSCRTRRGRRRSNMLRHRGTRGCVSPADPRPVEARTSAAVRRGSDSLSLHSEAR